MNNLVPTVKAEMDKSLATLTAESVVVRLFKELDKLRRGDPSTEEWFKTVLDVSVFSQQIEIGFGHARAYGLAIIKEQWDNIDSDIRKQYGFAFDTFASSITGKQPSTVHNYIRTAKTWFIDAVSPGRQIEITLRDNNGRPIRDEKGKIITEWKDFVPYNIDISKLLAVNSRATRGEMTDRLWEMLIDDFYTCEDVQKEAAGNGKEKDFYRPSFFLLGPALCAEVGGETVVIADELNWEGYENHEGTRETIDLLCKVLDVIRDEDRIQTLLRESYDKVS